MNAAPLPPHELALGLKSPRPIPLLHQLHPIEPGFDPGRVAAGDA
jgi:hypothetical protein